jgi:hypothetical protein
MTSRLQCFYSTPTFPKSVSLQVLRQKPSAGPNRLRDFWIGRSGAPEGKHEDVQDRCLGYQPGTDP